MKYNYIPISSFLNKFILLGLVGIVVLPLSIIGQDVTLESLTAHYERECVVLEKPFRDFQKTYENNLQKLLEKVTKAGELEKLVAVKAEIAGFREGKSPAVGDEFSELKRLQGIYAKSGAKVLASMEVTAKPLTADYKKRLEALKKQLTQQSKIEEALAVNKVITDLASRKTIFSAVAAPTAAATTTTVEAKEVPKKPMNQPIVGGDSNLDTDVKNATATTPFLNHLGMKFVPVPITSGPSKGKRVLFSIWETRVSDYEAFIIDVRNREWPKPDFPQSADHPAVNVTWDDANTFCKWLTERERRKRLIGRNDYYRLPTDHEWSCAVEIAHLEDPELLPIEKKSKLNGYPWGAAWPPPKGSGNFRGEEVTTEDKVIKGYNDGFERTSPVTAFAPGKFGIQGLNGNVREWCQDRMYDKNKGTQRVFRGGSWETDREGNLRSSARNNTTSGKRGDFSGFRVVCEIAD